MAHSTIHTDTAKESTLLTLTEYECISARACERRGTEWARGGARVRLVKRKPTGENCPSASRSEVIIGGARPRMRRGAALALALALLATAAWTPTGAAREKTPNLDPTAGHRLRGGAPLFDTDDDPSTIAPGPGEIGPTAPAPATALAVPEIPKVLHVVWKTEKLPKFAEKYVKSWTDNHPDWEVRRWTDESMVEFVKEHFPRDVAMFRSFPTGVFRADTFRYMLMSVIGGVYADLDMESLRPIDPLLRGQRCLVGQEPSAHAALIVSVPRHACNAWLASAPGVPFWDEVLSEVRTRSKGVMSRWNPPSVTGPEMLGAVMDRTGRGDGGCGLVDPPEALYPAVDKSAFNSMRERCEGVAPPAGGCPTPEYVLRGVAPAGPHAAVAGVAVRGEAPVEISLGEPIGEAPTMAWVCCRLAREGFVNPDREEMVRRGSFALHHWVHTWLDGPDARVTNVWRRRNILDDDGDDRHRW